MSDLVISADRLRDLVQQILSGAGFSDAEVEDGTDVLLWASLRGIDTHGVRNLKTYYVDPLRSGTLVPNVRCTIEVETASAARLDGHSGLGLAAACHAMRTAITKAAASGVGLVTLRNAHHLGAAGYFAQLATKHQMLGLCMTGHFFAAGNEYGISPINASHPMFSTNPLAFAAPTATLPPVVVDMASSIAPVNRAELYAEACRALPPDWALDQHGQPTTDPLAARQFQPIAGHKGIALATMVSILSGVLSGGWAVSQHDPACSEPEVSTYDQPTMGHFFAAIRIDQFLPYETFTRALDAMLMAIQSAPRRDAAAPILYPGLQEHGVAERRQRDGIPLSSTVARNLRRLAEDFDLDVRF